MGVRVERSRILYAHDFPGAALRANEVRARRGVQAFPCQRMASRWRKEETAFLWREFGRPTDGGLDPGEWSGGVSAVRSFADP